MLWKCAFWFFCCTYNFGRCTRKRFLNSFPSFYRLLSNVFCKNTKNTDTTILSIYSLSLVTIITGHLILTKNSKSERFVHFFARERQVTVLGKRQLCVVKCKRKDLLSTSIVEKLFFSKFVDIITIVPTATSAFCVL
jgi:hypothetical protein